MKEGAIKGDWKGHNASVNMTLPIMMFTEDNTHIAYIPVLDLSGYGTTEAEAHRSLTIAIDNYFDYTIAKNTLIQDLKAHGWIIKKKTKPYIAPEITDLINKNNFLHEIVNTKPYTMGRMDVAVPQCA
jgi:hypothetical protein